MNQPVATEFAARGGALVRTRKRCSDDVPGQGRKLNTRARAAAAAAEEECVRERVTLLHGHMGPVNIASICNAGYDNVNKNKKKIC